MRRRGDLASTIATAETGDYRLRANYRVSSDIVEYTVDYRWGFFLWRYHHSLLTLCEYSDHAESFERIAIDEFITFVNARYEWQKGITRRLDLFKKSNREK